MRPRRLIVLTLVLATLTGCVTPGKVSTDVFHSLTPAQRAEADVLEAAMGKLRAQCQAEHPEWPCVLPKILLTWEGTTPQYQPQGHLILIPAWALQPGGRITMAHELGHAWWIDAQNCSRERQAPCEWAANYHAAWVLHSAYGYSEAQAARLVYLWLVDGLLHSKPSRGHEDLCQELHEYERMTKWTTGPYPCTEVATR